MNDETKLVPTWIYQDGAEPKIVDLPEGAQAPDGWSFEPSGPPAPAYSEPVADDALAAASFDAGPIMQRLSAVEGRLQAVETILNQMSDANNDDYGGDEEERTIREMLEAEAEEIGLKVDKRWADSTLQKEIAKAKSGASSEDEPE